MLTGHHYHRIGSRGESAFGASIQRPVPGYLSLFAPMHMGERAEGLDYMVRLLAPDGSLLGPYFFCQVKTTTQANRSTPRRLMVNFDLSDIQLVTAMKIPTYVMGVDATNPNAEEVYFCGVDATRSRAIRAVKKVHHLAVDQERIALYREVKHFFAGRRYQFSSGFAPG